MGDAGPAEVSPSRPGLVRAISLASSSVVSELRPSPAASVQIARTTSSLALKRPSSPSGALRARRTRCSMSSSARCSSSTTRLRDSSAEFTSKYGFSVVAPIMTTVRFSTAWSRASCWEREKRWISSMNKMVRRSNIMRRCFASSISRRRSLTVPVTAETSTNSLLVCAAMICANVVLPVPAGPYRITLESTSCSMADRSQEPGPTAFF